MNRSNARIIGILRAFRGPTCTKGETPVVLPKYSPCAELGFPKIRIPFHCPLLESFRTILQMGSPNQQQQQYFWLLDTRTLWPGRKIADAVSPPFLIDLVACSLLSVPFPS